MAAPVIWFGSWVLSLMACSGCAAVARLLQLDVRENEKGPKRPLHTARMWMASATPGGAPGYDDDKQFGNNVAHLPAQASQRLRENSHPALNVKARTRSAALFRD